MCKVGTCSDSARPFNTVVWATGQDNEHIPLIQASYWGLQGDEVLLPGPEGRASHARGGKNQ